MRRLTTHLTARTGRHSAPRPARHRRNESSEESRLPGRPFRGLAAEKLAKIHRLRSPATGQNIGQQVDRNPRAYGTRSQQEQPPAPGPWPPAEHMDEQFDNADERTKRAADNL